MYFLEEVYQVFVEKFVWDTNSIYEFGIQSTTHLGVAVHATRERVRQKIKMYKQMYCQAPAHIPQSKTFENSKRVKGYSVCHIFFIFLSS